MPCAPNATDVGSQIICWLPMYLFVRGAGVLMGPRGTGTIPTYIWEVEYGGPQIDPASGAKCPCRTGVLTWGTS